MKQFFLTVAGVVAGMTIFFVGLPILFLAAALSAPRPVHAASVLELDLRGPLNDQDQQSPFAFLGARGHSVISVVETLHRAEADPRVKALFIRLPETGMSPGAADELRLAVKRFRAAGKPVLAHSQGFYPSGPVTSTYMLGASADQLWLQPGATFEAAGLASEDLFFKRFFDRYGVRPDYLQREEYKNAVNPYLHEDYTPAHREAQLSWMGSIYQSTLATAARDRQRDVVTLRQAIETGPHEAARAQNLGLVDRVGHLKEAQDAVLRRAGRGARLVSFEDYGEIARRTERVRRNAPKIAVVFAEGPIVTGDSRSGSVFGAEQTIYSDDTAKLLYEAAADREVKAIVFRVSSPGGVVTASEQILAAVRAAKAAGKPVVVSMGEYGASGGYWISSQASAIIAEPSTLTGSIGVYGGKLAFGPALSRFGIDVRQTTVGGPFAGAYGIGSEFTPEQRAAMERSIDTVYDGFVQRVSTGRKLKSERVREIAKGRVWTGAQAQALGLVDELGGYHQAIEKAKALAGIKGEVRLRRMTTSISPFEAFGRAMGADASAVKSLLRVGVLLSDPQARPLVDELTAARLRSQGAAVLAPVPAWR